MSRDAQRLSRVTVFRARMAGVVARRDGKPATACPYSPGGALAERTKARYWLRGWVRADRVLREQATQAP